MFPYIGGQIPQPNNSVETAMRSFSGTQKAIADRLALDQQRQLNKVYPQMLQQQIDLGGAQLAELETKNKYAPQNAEANYAKLLAETEALNRQNELQKKHGEKALLADINYKSGIASSAQSNAATA